MDQLSPAARGRTRVRRLARAATLGFIPLAATLLSTCSETPTAPNRPGFGFVAVEGVLPSAQLPPNLTLNRVHLLVKRRPNLTLLDKTYPFAATSQQLTISAQLLLQSQAESLLVTLEYLSGTTLLFSGTDTLLVRQGPPGSNPTAQIATKYVGPGMNVAAITIQPRDTILTFGADLPFRVTGVDGQGLPVTSFYVTWTSSDPQQILNGAGSLHAAAKRSVVTITATTPNTPTAPSGVTDQTTITIVPAPTKLGLSGGDNQTASVGTQLPQQLAVVVRGADNLPVPGAVVSFAPKTGGGSVDSLTATSDLNGIARTDATLGPLTGNQTFIARLAALDSITFSANAIGIITTQPVPLVAGQDHSCALAAGGVTVCWGDNSKGQIGDGTTLAQLSPRAVVGGNLFVSLAAGGAHTCGITASGQAYCWGDNASAQLGDGGTTPSLTPKAVSGGLSFSQLAAGSNYTCGLTTTGQAYCWGSNARGNLGDGSTTPRNVPTAVSGGLTFAMIVVGGDNHTCALTGGGQAYCWGYNFDGELGDGTTTDRPVPTSVAGGRFFIAISAGTFHTCAITVAGAGFCWGDNNARQVGDGSVTDQLSPVAVQGGRVFTALSAGNVHTCAITATDRGFCWGGNGAGQIGDGSTITALQPTAVSGGLTFNAVAAGGNHSCGRDSSGILHCWGENNTGEVGDGTSTNRLAAVGVLPAGGVATTIAVNQGDGQTAAPGGTVTPVPCVLITDANGLPVQGVTVTFAMASGNGSITGPTAATSAAGIACVGSWTLGPLPGTNTLTATATGGGISGNPLTFTATALIAGLRTWVGALSTDWNTAGNWFPSVVPSLTETVNIPFAGVTNFPVLSAAGFANDLTLATGATLTITGTSLLTVDGNLDLSGTLTAATGSVQLGGTGKTLRGTLNAPGTTISGSYTLNGALSSNGGLSIAGASASLALGGNTATISGGFTTSAGGVLIMTDAADNLTLAGVAGFGGGDETGKLTAGTLTIGAGFDQTGPIATSFAASAAHQTVLQDPNSQHTITFANPGQSGFGALQVLTTFGVHLGSAISVAGDLSVNGAGIGGNLLLDGHTVTVGGNFAVSQSGKISMVLALDSLLVSGDASFSGADENGRLSNGVLRVGGNFGQSAAGGSTTSFTATGSHKTILGAAVAHTVGFQNAGASGATSRFQDLDVAGATGNLNLTSNLFVSGQLSSRPPSGAPRLVGSGAARTITVVGVDATSLVFDNAPFVINGGTIGLFDNISFLNTPATATALSVNNPGRATPFAFSNLVFGSVPTTGFYLQANDSNTGDGLSLTLNLVNPTPGVPGAFLQLLNGALVNWPGVIPIRTWVGALSTDWFNPGNWSPAGVPGLGEDVSVPNVANLPVLTTTGALAQNLTGLSGASLGLAGFNLTVSGNADWQGSMSSSGGAIVLAGGARTVKGTFAALTVSGGYSLAGPTTVTGNMTVNSGAITLASQGLTVNGALQVQGTGTVTMTDAADQLTVAGDAAFTGGDETGKLTAGTLRLGGNFSLNAATAFIASGTHTTIVDGAAAQSISIPVTGAQFQILQIANTAGGVSFPSAVTAAGAVSVTTPTSVTGAGTVTTPSLTTVAGSSFGPAGLSISGTLNVAGTYAVGTTTFTGGTTVPVLAYNNLTVALASGSLALSGATAVSGTLSVGPGDLNLNAKTLTVGGSFQTITGGTVSMTDAADQLTVAGDAAFTGGDETGKLTAGTLRLGGNFSLNAATAFIASGTHTTIVDGAAAQSISIPVTGAQFQILQIANTAGGVSFPSAVTAAGAVSVTTPTSVTGAGTVTTPSLTTVAGSSFGPAGLSTDASALTIAGSYSVGTTTFTAGTTVPVLAYNNLTVALASGSLALSGATAVSGTLSVGPGDLNLNAKTLTVGGSFQTITGGTVSMTNAADQLTVAGDAAFTGGDETGKLTAGTLRLGGNFSLNAATAFIASGTHTTIVDGAAAQSISIPVTGAQFQILQIANTAGGVSFPSAVTAAGAVSVTTPTSVTGAGTVTTPSLTTVAGSSFGPAGLSISGTLNVAGTYAVGTTTFTGGTTVPVLAYQNLVISVPTTIGLTGATTVTGNLTAAGGSLNLGGRAIAVGGSFQTITGGTVSMTNAADQLTVAGDAAFTGGDETGKLTAGTLRLGGNFSLNAATAFIASGTHTTIVDGAAAQSISIPVSGAQFQNLQVTNTAAPVSLLGTIVALGQLSVTNTAIRLNGGGNPLSVGGLAVTGLTLDNVLFTLDATTAAAEAFDNVIFQSYASTATQFTVNHPGLVGAALGFTNLTFTTQPTTGFYVRANDTNGATGGILSLNITSSGTPSAPLGTSLTQLVNGALVSWGLVGGPPTWTGLLSTDWSNAANWSTAAVPTAASDVTLPTGALNQPVLTAAVNPVNTLAMAAGATLTMSGSQVLQVNGDFSQLGTIIVSAGTPGVFLLGSGRVAGGSSGAAIFVEGSYTLGSALTLTGIADLTVQVSGQLTLNGQRATVGGNFVTSGSGHLVMTNASDTLVATSALFGSNAPGTISAGGIKVNGQLNQTLAGAIGFAATGTNTVIFTGASPASISFANSSPATGPNFLRHLRSEKTAGLTTVTSPLRITGDLDMTPGSRGGVTGATNIFVGGAIGVGAGNPISVDTLSIGGTLSVSQSDFQVPLVRFLGLAGQTVPTNLFYQNMDFLTTVGLGGGFGMSGRLTVGANVVLNGNATTGELLIDAGGLLDVNGNQVTDNGDLITQNGGQLKMANASDQVNVEGNAIFNGGDETGLLTDGVINLAGNFSENGPGNNSFVASGAHKVSLDGSGPQTISFAHAGPAPQSHFQELESFNGGTVSILTPVYVAGAASFLSPGTTLDGPGTLNTGSLSTISGSTVSVSTLQMRSDVVSVLGTFAVPNTQFTGGTTLPSLTYQNLQITVPATMTVSGPTSLTGNLVIDQGTLDVGGNILIVGGNLQTDANGSLKMAAPRDSVVVNGQTAFGGASTAGLLTSGVLDVKQNFTQTAGFSPQSFAPSASHLTAFTGTVPQTINFVGGAPSGFQNLQISNFSAAVTLGSAVNAFGGVTIFASTLFGGSLTTPALSSDESSTVQVGTLTMTDNQLFIGGPYDVGLTIFGSPTYPDSTTLPFAPYKNLQISLPGSHVIFLPGDITVSNDLLIDGGNLNIGGSQLIVNGNFTTAGSGIFEMNNGSARMEVDGKALFSGGSTVGRLGDGFLDLRGDVTQASTISTSSFAADGSHLTQVNPTGTKTFFESPSTGASHFGNVVYSGLGTWSIASSVVITGVFEAFDGTGGIATTSPGSTITAGDLFSGSLTFDGVPLIIDDPAGFSSGFSGFSFINISPSVTQITIRSPSPGFTFTLDNITFTPLTSGDTGFYIDAKDIDGPVPDQLTIDVTNSNQSPSNGGNGPSFTTTDGVATVTWQ